jgi:hypothetical protein
MESLLHSWDSFYVIVGSSAGALTGLQFVVMALIAESSQRPTNETVGTFATPTIVHFGVVLLVAAILNAPWPSWSGAIVTLAMLAAWGVAYTIIVYRRARDVTEYKPVLEDWLFHVAFPLLAYTLLLGASIALASFPMRALFIIGGVTLLLLFTGIHNAWDSVTFIVVERMHSPKKSETTDSN